MPSAYDQVLYRGLPFSQSHPDRLATLGILFGLEPIPIDRCRVLELGCADGGNLIPMAFEFRESEFLGIDTARQMISRGQETLARLGLSNIRLEQMDVMEAGPDLGKFDYIIAHGLYSWVAEPVRRQVLAVTKANLARQGIAYISYNALPGSRIREMFRDMLLFHVRDLDDPHARSERARDFLKMYIEAQSGSGADRVCLRQEAQVLIDQGPSVLCHDELSEDYYALYFHEFISQASQYGLQFLSEAVFSDLQPAKHPAAVLSEMEQFWAGDRILREQYLDFLKCRKFRQTLLCHAEHPVPAEPLPDHVRRLCAASPAEPLSSRPDLTPGVPEEFRGVRGSAVKTAHPLAKAAMAFLCDAWPEAVWFDDLVAAAAKLTSEPPDPDGLAEILLATYAAGVVELRSRPPRCVAKPGTFPRVTELARLQAERGEYITTPRHTTVDATGQMERRLVALLDGTHDIASLAREIRKVVDAPEKVTEQAIVCQVEANLAKLARFGLLVA